MSNSSQNSTVKRLKNFCTTHEKILTVILSGILVGNVILTVYSFRSLYTSRDYWKRYPELKREYYASQYGRKNPELYLVDETVNAYAGGAQISGTSPVFIAPDTPPLGRYLIGLSALLFNNENIITLVSACISLLLMFLIGRQIFSSMIMATIPPLLLSFEPMFKNQLRFTPLLDIIQLLFLLAVFYTFNKLWKRNVHPLILFVLVSFFIGCFMSVKFFATGVTIILAIFIVLIMHKNWKYLSYFLLSLPVAVLVLLSTYITVFSEGYTVMRFLGIQRWVLEYHKSQLILPFSIWPLILLNKWYVWFGDKPVISDAQWRISWPFITVSSLIGSVVYIWEKVPHRKEVEVLFVWVWCYFLFFSVGQISARYFVILIPILYLITIYFIEKVILLIGRTR